MLEVRGHPVAVVMQWLSPAHCRWTPGTRRPSDGRCTPAWSHPSPHTTAAPGCPRRLEINQSLISQYTSPSTQHKNRLPLFFSVRKEPVIWSEPDQTSLSQGYIWKRDVRLTETGQCKPTNTKHFSHSFLLIGSLRMLESLVLIPAILNIWGLSFPTESPLFHRCCLSVYKQSHPFSHSPLPLHLWNVYSTHLNISTAFPCILNLCF